MVDSFTEFPLPILEAFYQFDLSCNHSDFILSLNATEIE